MKLKISLLIVLFSVINTIAQDYFPKKEVFNGHYYSLKPMELRSGGVAETVSCEVGEINVAKQLGLIMLYAEGYMPGLYKFKPESAKEIKKAVFFNDWGVLVIEYDKESFIRLMPTESKPRVDFFSKSKSKVKAMTEEKAIAYAMKCMDELE